MHTFDYDPIFNKTVLKNGVRVLTEHHPYTRAVSAGIYVDLGTRDEPKQLGGSAHFIEHLVFKGTKTRTAFEIAKSLEMVGGEANAYTDRESTCFHAATLREDLSLNLDILADLVSHAKFSQDDYDKEKLVIQQEIDMSRDLLEEYIFDLYFEKAYKGHQLGLPILGTKESLNSMRKADVIDFYKTKYQGKNLIVSVAGHVDHDKVVKQLTPLLSKIKKTNQANKRRKPSIKAFREVIKKPSEQVHILMGLPSSSFTDKYRFEAYIVNALLGGGMTSRLYQKVRERQGLAYSVYSYLHSFSDSGLLMLYVATHEDHLKKVIQICCKELVALVDKGIKASELKLFKKQVMGQIIIGADDIENRMNSLAVNEMVFNLYRPVDEIIEEIESISLSSIKDYIHKYYNFEKMGVIVMGDVNKKKTEDFINKL